MRPRRPVDTRPALLSVVALMFLLLPLLLLTSSASKLAGIDLGLLGDAGELPPPPGPVESLEIVLQPDEGLGHPLLIRAGLRRADLGAGPGAIRLQEEALPPRGGEADLAGLQARLRTWKALDPTRSRAVLSPADAVPTAAVVQVLDAIRADRQGPLYPEVVLSTEPAP